MKTKIAAIAGSVLLCFSAAVSAEGNIDAGKAKFDAKCEECHYDDDFSGESASEIAGLIQAIVDGADHKSDLSKLSAETVADLAAFFASK